MRAHWILSACVITVLFLTEPAPAQAPALPGQTGDTGVLLETGPSLLSSMPSEACPAWLSVESNAVFLQRSRPSNAPLVRNGNNGVVLDANQFHFDFEPGWEITASVWTSPNLGFEARYLAINDWRSDVAGPVDPQNSFALSYHSNLHSAEANGKVRLTDWLNLLAGFRYVSLDEVVNAHIEGIGVEASLPVHNDLYGGQLGLEANWRWQRLGIGCRASAGVFDNHADGRLSVQIANQGNIFVRGTAEHTAFVGELAVSGNVRLTNHIYLQAGYQMMWVDGVATSTGQVGRAMGSNGNLNVGVTDTVFYHGAFGGLGIKW